MGKRRYDAEQVSIAIGINVRKLRHAKKWTLEQTEDFGWPSWRFLLQIESGKSNITIQTLVNLANLFGVDPASLLETI
jgi:transcriptional regulator with XRE-family HTH domain